MAGSKSDYLEPIVANWLLGGGSQPSKLTGYYLGLFTTAPSDAGGGVEVPSTNSYQRYYIRSVEDFIVGSNFASNFGAIQYITATGAGWGTIVAAGLFDAFTGGHLLWWATVNTPLAVAGGDSAQFPDGQLQFREGGNKTTYMTNVVLKSIFGPVFSYAKPINHYLALYSVAPTATLPGTELTIATAPGYARIAIPNTAAYWPTITANQIKSNPFGYNFAAAQSSAWPTINGVALLDAATGGNILFFNSFGPFTVLGQQWITIAPGDIRITED